MGMPPVKELALEHGIHVYQPVKARDEEFINTLKEINPDLIIVVAYGQILPKALLDIPKLGCINVHVSLLPKYRGAAPINWVIINGEEKTGVTAMYMDEGLDTGDIILQSEFALSNEITAGELHDMMMEQGGNLLIETINQIEKGCNISICCILFVCLYIFVEEFCFPGNAFLQFDDSGRSTDNSSQLQLHTSHFLYG